MKQTHSPKAVLVGLALILAGGLGLSVLAPAVIGSGFGASPVLADTDECTAKQGTCKTKCGDNEQDIGKIEPCFLKKGETCCVPKSGADTGAAAGGTTTAGGQTSKKISTPTPIGNVDPNTVIGRVIKGFVGAVGVVALIMFIYAGFLMMTAGGNAQQVDKGKKTMIWATIGLIGVFLSYAAVEAVLKTLGAS